MRSEVSRITLARRGALALLGAVAALGIFAAQPAQAGNEFADGFEDQLGRIAAYEAVSFGKLILSGGSHHAHYRPVASVRHPHSHRPFWRRARYERERRARLERERRERERWARREREHRAHEGSCHGARVVYDRTDRFREDGDILIKRTLRCSDGTRVVTRRRVSY